MYSLSINVFNKWKSSSQVYFSSHCPDFNIVLKEVFFQVAGLYRDASIGNAINIVVVRLILLEKDEVKTDFCILMKGGFISFHIKSQIQNSWPQKFFNSLVSWKLVLPVLFSYFFQVWVRMTRFTYSLGFFPFNEWNPIQNDWKLRNITCF